MAATFKAASFSVCQITVEKGVKKDAVVKKATSDVVIVTTPLIKEGDEEKSQKFSFDFEYAVTEVPYFLPVLRAGPSANYLNLYALVKGKSAPLFMLNCNFRI